MFVDSHTHLYSKKFDGDREEMVQRAIDVGVEAFYLPNIDSSSIDAMLKVEEKWPNRCFAMMGLHPCSVKENYQDELAVVEEWLNKREFCAVGEIGIDLYWDKTFLAQQKEAFLTQVQWAKDRRLPIVIHSREATDLIIELLQGVNDDRLKGIFHCFTGSPAQAKKITDLGFYLGIGGVLTFKNAGLDKTMETVDPDHLVLETDSPYLAPAPHRGKRNESAYLVRVAERLAEIKNAPVENIGRITSRNSYAVFGKSGIFVPQATD